MGAAAEKRDLILMRHGNTFAPGHKVVWVGKTLDLPLVSSGAEQARACAAALKTAGAPVGAVYAGGLERTRRFAQVVCEELGLAVDPVIDKRLDELDYGGWTGLSKEEVISKFGADALQAWESSCAWPKNSGWSGDEGGVISEVQAFAAELTAPVTAAVSSNGRLRYFLKLAPGAFEQRVKEHVFSVRTGHICHLRFVEGRWAVLGWNLPPREFSQSYRAL